jgi:hypothetical protein
VLSSKQDIIIRNKNRKIYAAKSCDAIVEKKTKDLTIPIVELDKHFVTMYIKIQTNQHIIEWRLHGYRCIHCDKIAATQPDLAKKHLYICIALKKQKIEF